MNNQSSIKKSRWLSWISLVIMMTVILCLPSAAAQSESRVLEVPFVELEGLMETAPDGSRHGLVVDYLNEIAKYTGWEYKYIDTVGDFMVNEFIDGQYDIMGAAYYLPSLEQYFSYPDYNMGYSKAVLLARKDDERIHGIDPQTLNGKTIGVYERAIENIRRLKEFLSMHGLNCTFKYYSFEELTPYGTLYPYLESGEVDLLLGNSTELNTPFRVAFSYDSQPYYIVARVGDDEMIDEINMAMKRILESNPNFAAERYAANFADSTSVDIYLTLEDIQYIQQKGIVTVAVPEDFHPLSCRTVGCMHDGLTESVLKEVTAFTSLEFSYVYTDTYGDAMSLVQQGKADMMGFFLGTENESRADDLVLTSPFASMNSIVARNKAVNFPDSNLIGAVIEGQNLPDGIDSSQVLIYSDAEAALRAVNRGEADFVYGLSSYLESKLQRRHYANVIPVTIVNNRSNICFALPRPANPQLLTVLNKAINNMSGARKSALLDQNMVAAGTGQFSLMEMIYASPAMFISFVALLFIVLITATLLIARTKLKAAVIQSSLEKAEAENRAKGDFLSRMSHELRTPMNAVVGLADLTLMAEGVPENVQQNLSKLRTSSYYLLDLINDILDTSRLDSGMLTISREPFSLEDMLARIQSMMESDAERRGLVYTLEENINHSNVCGDITRLRQVLTNLLSNAFKFTPEGGQVTLRVTETSCSRQDASYLFQVIDSGVGIAPEDQERIFEVFEQVGTNYSKSQGTGLGLPISRKIVRLMGGDLHVDSAPDRGSEFFFEISLPLDAPVAADSAAQDAAAADTALDGIRILLVEDNDLNAEIAMELLTMRGAQVTRSENGMLAVEQFARSRENEIQAVLMDIQMPVMNGLDATRAIRGLQRPDAQSVPIIAMTANAFQEDVDASIAAGMNGFVSKPMDVNHLFKLLHDLINDRRK